MTELSGDQRDEVARIIEIVAQDGLPGPRDLDVALDAIGSALSPGKITDEQREKLDGELKALDTLAASIRKQREPYDKMLREVDGLIAQALERYSIKGDTGRRVSGARS